MLNFSIIIPVYNVSKFIVDCLESVMEQDVEKSTFEVIVVDDCSPGNELKIVENFQKKYSNVRYIRHDVNKRQGGARNTGIRAAQGEYVMFIDGDDILYYKNTLSVLLQYVEEYKPLILRSEMFQTFPSELCYSKLDYISVDVKSVKYTTADFVDWRSGEMSCSVCGTLYKRKLLLENALFFRENVWYEDTDWTQKVMYYAGKVDFLDFAYYGYRQSPNSTTRGHSVARFEGAIDGVVETYKFYKDIDISDEFRCFIYDKIVDDTIGFLKFSRNYPIKSSLRMLNKINDSGLTTLKSSWKKDSILYIMKNVPLFPLIVVRLGVFLKRGFMFILQR